MKTLLNCCRPVICGALLLWGTSAGAAETNMLRLAIGPIFAPAGNAALEKAATTLPDMITADLSRDSRFQMVERDKVNAIWSEIHLAEGERMSANAVIKMGHFLSCDWLVSGSFAQTDTGPQIWVKVINIQDSVVVDLECVPFDQTNYSATAKAIADFLVKARARSKPSEFIALGKFQDMSITANKENWAPRLVALLEKHLLAAGYGVVERAAIGPIYTEFEFQNAGLTSTSSNRVRLKPAFWIIDGGCKWFHDTQDKLSVTVRIQKMGGGEELFSFSKPPGKELEKEVLNTVQKALATSRSPTLAQALAGEVKMLAARQAELDKGRDGPMPPVIQTNNPTFITVTNPDGGKRKLQVDPVMLAQREYHSNEVHRTLMQSILLLMGKDMESKWKMGRALYKSENAADSRRGEKLLEEVAASGDPKFAIMAKNWLEDFRTGRLTIKRNPIGVEIVEHPELGEAKSLPSKASRDAGSETWLAKQARLQIITNIVPRAATVATIRASWEGGANLGHIKATKAWKNKIFFATDTLVQCYDSETKELTFVRLPSPWKHPIRAIEADENGLWLGTSDGLFRITGGSATVREYGIKDGFPQAGISALRLAGGKLFIGAGSNREGKFGWLELATDKFTGIASPHLPRSIMMLDAKTVWVGSLISQQLDLASRSWKNEVPEGYKDRALTQIPDDRAAAINSKYLAIVMPQRCVGIYRLATKQWQCVNISTNEMENTGESLAFDPTNPDWLWIGGQTGKLVLLNIATSQILGEVVTMNNDPIQGIFPMPNRVIFLSQQIPSNEGDLFCIDKSGFLKQLPESSRPGIKVVDEVAERRAFLQQNFSKFVPVQFQKGANGEALIQQLPVRQNLMEYKGDYYCGFRFTAPEWIDGDFEWIFALAKTEAQKNFSIPGGTMGWYIVPETGNSDGFKEFSTVDLGDYPSLKQRFPYTHTLTVQSLDRGCLQPDKTYAIWFSFKQKDMPDFGFSMTITSKRGLEEFGKLPFSFKPAHPPTQNPVIAKAPPASAEELRSAFEAAIKAKDSYAFYGLYCYQDVSEERKIRHFQEVIPTWFERDNPKITLKDLWPGEKLTNVVNGTLYRPNITVIGNLSYSPGEKWGMGTLLSYGKLGDAYYIAIVITESVKK